MWGFTVVPFSGRMPLNFCRISRQQYAFLEIIMFTSSVNDLGEGRITKRWCRWQTQTLACAGNSDFVSLNTIYL